MRKILSLLSLFLLVVLAAQAGAENLMLDEIVVKGEKEPPREESLTVKEVRESSAKDIGEALKLVEGIDIVRKGAIANDVVLRGFQRENINVLVDGARMHGACPNRMDPPAFHYDFAEIEQIKIIKGPYDLQNPGGLGGTVDARTKRPGMGLGGELNLTYGSYDSLNASATASYGTEAYDGLIGYAYKYSDVPKSGNGKLITDIYPATSPNRYRADTIDSRAYEINTGWAKAGFNLTDKSRTELGYTYQDARHVLYPYLKMDADYDKAHRLNWLLKAEKPSPVVSELNLQAYWDRVDHVMDDSLRASSLPTPTVTRGFSMLTDASSKVAGAKANASIPVGPGTMRSGVDYYHRKWDAVNLRAMFTMAQAYTPVNMIPDAAVDNVGVFSEYELPLSKSFKMKGGLRGDLSWIDTDKNNNATATDGSANFQELSGNLQLTYTPLGGVEIFTGLARGVRIPDPQELYIDLPAMAPSVTWRGNPLLAPTINHQADLGIKVSSGRFYVNGSLFYSDLHDYINPFAASTTLKSYQNIDASIWGAEMGSQVALPLNLYLKGTLSYTEGRNEDGDRPLAEIPPLRGSVSARYDVETWFFEVTENLADRQDRVDASLKEQPTPGWSTTDLKTGVKYRGLSLYAGINNLWDRQYVSHLSYQRDPFAGGVKVPENGRNYYVTAAYRF